LWRDPQQRDLRCDLRTYVSSLDKLGRSTLRRVVSTAGRWLVVFEEPLEVFTAEGPPNIGLIHCFVSLEDILDRHAALFRLPRIAVLRSSDNVAKIIDTCAEEADRSNASAVVHKSRSEAEGALFRQLIDSTEMEKR
jgi:hypothetical protein